MYWIDFLIPWIILALNEILKSISEKGVKWIKYETRSEEISKIQSAVFILNFINGGLTLLLINANFTGENNLPSKKKGFLYFLFDGSYTDLSDEWFQNIAYFFIAPLFLETIYPVIEFTWKDWASRAIKRLIDWSFSCDKNRTKQATALAYANVYSGKEMEF